MREAFGISWRADGRRGRSIDGGWQVEIYGGEEGQRFFAAINRPFSRPIVVSGEDLAEVQEAAADAIREERGALLQGTSWRSEPARFPYG